MPPTLTAVARAAANMLSPAAPQVLSLWSSPEPEMERLRAAVQVDPVLTIKVIRHANHSHYSRRVPVVSVRRAFTRLGWQTSLELLTRFLVEGAVSAAGPVAALAWEQAVDVAALARLLARISGRLDPAVAYTAGLTHNLGQIGLEKVYRQKYESLYMAAECSVSLIAQEREMFGYDHAAVGAELLSLLHMPDTVVMAVRRQHSASLGEGEWSDSSDALAAVLHLAVLAVHQDGRRIDSAEWWAGQPLAGRLGLSPDGLSDLRPRFDRARESAVAEPSAAA